MKNEEIKNDFKAKGIRKAKQELDILKLSDEERRAYERYQDDLHYQASMVESSYVVGIKKGRKQRDMEIARELLAGGQLDIQTISQVTGLTTEEVEALRQE